MNAKPIFDAISASWTLKGSIASIYDDTQKAGVVVHQPEGYNRPIVAFRSTSNFENVKDDMNVLPERLPKGTWSTAGFAEVYAALAPRLFEALKANNITAVAVVGHSLGSALGAIFAADWVKKGHSVVELVLLAFPACLDKDSVEMLQKHTSVSSYINGRDAIRWVIPGYSRFPFIRIGNPNRFNWWKVASQLDHQVSSTPGKAVGYKEALTAYLAAKGQA